MNDKKTLLIIEDEKLLVEAIEKALGVLDISVTSANDGAEGLRLALEQHPDLILLDIVLPSMDGMTVLDKLREDEWGKDAPVIILSNLSKEDTDEDSNKKGVRDYLVKTDWKLSDVVEKVKNELKI